ncbi:putative c'cytochrome [Anopheles sinensis]|uniref:Putative c'cytochrome n=1 Tax=Anopheles sinensis TaxID=74873 RepID=A0A084WI35_ANOSI|nr:putative c'cytochrome [Anopheles sinensis]
MVIQLARKTRVSSSCLEDDANSAKPIGSTSSAFAPRFAHRFARIFCERLERLRVLASKRKHRRPSGAHERCFLSLRYAGPVCGGALGWLAGRDGHKIEPLRAAYKSKRERNEESASERYEISVRSRTCRNFTTNNFGWTVRYPGWEDGNGSEPESPAAPKPDWNHIPATKRSQSGWRKLFWAIAACDASRGRHNTNFRARIMKSYGTRTPANVFRRDASR